MRSLPVFEDLAARERLEELCSARGIEADLVEQLAEKLREHSGRGRKEGITEDFSAVFLGFLETHSGQAGSRSDEG